MFLFADLLCCAAVFPIFYGMFNKSITKKLSFYSVTLGLISGLALFPNQTFEKSLLVGNMLPVSFFPNWISSALLFWSFILATFVPIAVVLLLNRSEKKAFNFNKIRNEVRKH